MPGDRCTPAIALKHMFAITDVGSARNSQLLRSFELAGVGGNVTLIPAVMKRDIEGSPFLHHQASLLRQGNFTEYKHINNLEIAISLSHRNFHHMVLTNKWPCAIVFENDVALAPNFLERVRAATFPVAFDWIKMSTLVQQPTKESTDLSYPVSVDGVPGGSRDAGGTAGYVVSTTGAALLAAVNTPIWMTADGAMWRRHIASKSAHLQSMGLLGLRPPQQLYMHPTMAWQSSRWGLLDECVYHKTCSH
jgi:GR25 family glycosyltransferase involved in LPS biosynthesis